MSTALLIREAAGTDSPFTTPALIKSGTLMASSTSSSINLTCTPYYHSGASNRPSSFASIWTTDDANTLKLELSGGYWILGFRFKSIHWSTAAPIEAVLYNCIFIRYNSLGWGYGTPFEDNLYFSIAAGGSDGENIREFSTSPDTIYPITMRYSDSATYPRLYAFCPLNANYLQTLSIEYELYGFSV